MPPNDTQNWLVGCYGLTSASDQAVRVFLVRAEGVEPSLPSGKQIFIPTTACTALMIRGLWSGLSLRHSKLALGAARLVSTPSLPKSGLARDCRISGFSEFEQFYISGFPESTQIFLSPLRLPIPPRPQNLVITMEE